MTETSGRPRPTLLEGPSCHRFQLGSVSATPGALAYLAECDRYPAELLAFHAGCQWGDVDKEDAAANERALKDGGRILSSYLVEGRKIWVITEAAGEDGCRASTTLLLPEEY